MLFFLFACIGNLTYVLSILAYDPTPNCRGAHSYYYPRRRSCGPGEASAIYGRYIAVNFSWLLGSFGTLLLDAGVFVQYFLYKTEDAEDAERGGANGSKATNGRAENGHGRENR